MLLLQVLFKTAGFRLALYRPGQAHSSITKYSAGNSESLRQHRRYAAAARVRCC